MNVRVVIVMAVVRVELLSQYVTGDSLYIEHVQF